MDKTIPTDTEILNECLVPYCGISITLSEASTTFWATPLTSFPKINAYFLFFSYLKSLSNVAFSTCSTEIIFTSFCFKEFTSSIIFLWYYIIYYYILNGPKGPIGPKWDPELSIHLPCLLCIQIIMRWDRGVAAVLSFECNKALCKCAPVRETTQRAIIPE